MALTLATPYATEQEADDHIGAVDPWDSATSAEKQNALEQAKIYMDYYYSSLTEYTQANAPDPVKIANITLAHASLSNSLFTTNDSKGVMRERVRAGEVESDIMYTTTAHGFKDLYPSVTAMLAPYMTFSVGMNYLSRA